MLQILQTADTDGNGNINFTSKEQVMKRDIIGNQKLGMLEQLVRQMQNKSKHVK